MKNKEQKNIKKLLIQIFSIPPKVLKRIIPSYHIVGYYLSFRASEESPPSANATLTKDSEMDGNGAEKTLP